MKKTKTVFLISVSALLSIFLSAYLVLGFASTKVGISGFAVTNGMIRLLISDKDYVRVGKHKYLCKKESVHKIVEAEYDSYRFRKDTLSEEEKLLPLDEIYETSLIKTCIVSKDGQEYKAATNGVWGNLFDLNGIYYAVHFKPYDE